MRRINFFNWFLILILAECVVLTSCSDDNDMSLRGMQDEILRNGNDLLSNNIYGAVKTISSTIYLNPSWENGTVNKGLKDRETIEEYDAKGFLKSENVISYNYYNFLDEIYLLNYKYTSKLTVLSRDIKNRELEVEYENMSIYESGEEMSYLSSKRVFEYDDIKNEATVFDYYKRSTEEEYEISSKTIYKLNEYGKIDNNNFQQFAQLRSTASENEIEFNDIPYYEGITKFDEKGNITLSYSINKYDDTIKIVSYKEYSYVYY